MKTKARKAIWITLIVLVSLVLVAIIIGALNATVGGGRWKIGWQNYKYDEVGFTVGDGTVFDKKVTAIDLDWISGDVKIVVTEDDLQVSLSESSDEALSESAKLRWRVDEDGTLVVKNRESGTYFASAAREKDLILRIPVAMASALQEVDLNVVDGKLSVNGLTANEMEIESVASQVALENCKLLDLEITSVSGNVRFVGEVTNVLTVETVSGVLELSPSFCANQTKIDTVGGDVTIALPSDASFRLDFETVGGKLFSDFALSQNGETRICGAGTYPIAVETVGGDLTISKR